MNKMIVSNLAYRPLRSIISILAVAIEVTLILLIVGLMLGILDDTKERQKGVGADVIVRPPGSANFAAFSAAPVSVKYAGILAGQPHVAAVTPVVLQTTVDLKGIEVLNGIDLPSFESVGGPLRYIEGGRFQTPDDMIVDDIYANGNKVHIGSVVKVLNHDFHVCGVIPHGRGSRRYVPIQTMQELLDSKGKASVFYVKLDDPDNDGIAVQEFKKILTISTSSQPAKGCS